MIHHHQTADATQPRRGALLLLVLSVLTLFMMISTLMLVLATRARTSARAFADAVAGPGMQTNQARVLLDEALMTLLRGKAPTADGDDPDWQGESLLADRYGDDTLEGEITQITPMGPILRAQLTFDPPRDAQQPPPQQLHGRILTIIPTASDPAPISSFRILAVDGNAADLANLRTVAVRNMPTRFPCRFIINGRDFAGAANDTNESWDAYDEKNPFLTKAAWNATAGQAIIQRPAFGVESADPNDAPKVDNDGDGVLDGVFLEDVLPESASGLVARVSYLVLDLGGRLNINAHGALPPKTGSGPAAVDGQDVFPQSSRTWNALLSGGDTAAQPQEPSRGSRRSPPALGPAVQGRYGSVGNTGDPYGLRLDFDGPRFASLTSSAANLFTCGELEPVLRPFDVDTRTLPARLTALLGDDTEAVRLLVTTDSWDTCGVVGSIANTVIGSEEFAELPDDTKEGLRFDLDHPDRSLNDPDAKQRLFEGLVALLAAAGVADANAAQWAANVIDFADTDTDSDQFQDARGGPVQGVEPSSVQKNGQPVFAGWDRGQIKSVGELLGVPKGSKQQLEAALEDGPPPPPEEVRAMLRSLVVDEPEIIDAITVGSPFRTTVFLDVGGRRLCRWREPGRVNVNTCDDRVWDAVTGTDMANPFQGPVPAKSIADVLERAPDIFGQADKHAPSLDRELASRLANIGTTRSDVFAVWITLELKKSADDTTAEYHRLFAIIDRSIPVGYAPGQNLNVRDTVRAQRFLE